MTGKGDPVIFSTRKSDKCACEAIRINERKGIRYDLSGKVFLSIGVFLPVFFVLFQGSMSGEDLAGGWRFESGAEFPGAKGTLTQDAGSAVLKYDFSDGGRYVAAYRDLQPPLHLKAVRFMLKKALEAGITFRAIDSAGQCFQKNLSFEALGERDVTVSMNNWSGHWGGSNDGVFRPPVHTMGILVEAADLADPKGEITFRNVRFDMVEPDSAFGTGQDEAVLSYQVTDFGKDCVLAKSLGDRLESGTWHIDFGSGGSAAMSGSLSLFHHPVTLKLHARASAPGAALVFHIGAHFQNFTRRVGILDGTDQVFTFTLPPDGWEASGAAHTTLHYPLRITGIVVEKNECRESRMDLRLGEITCETKHDRNAPTVAHAVLMPGMVQGGQRPFTLQLDFWNLLDDAVSGSAEVRVANWNGEELATTVIPVTLPGRGVKGRVEHSFVVPSGLRYVEAACSLNVAGPASAGAMSTFTVDLTEEGQEEKMPPPQRALCPESPWGMGVYLYRYPNSESGLAEMERAAGLAEEAGVKWTREEFNYSMIEKEPGAYDFSFFDRIVETATRHGISIYGLLGYWSPFIEQPYSEEGIAAYCDYARATVRHFKGRIRHWEIYNEPNIFFWNGPKELYPELVRRAGSVIKEEDPDACVLAISTAGIDRAFIRKVVETGAPFDALTVHPYREELLESKFIRELRGAATLAGERPVWITEMGWSTQVNGGNSEREQAQMLARAYLAAVGAGVRNMGWYNFRNDGDDLFYNEENFGVLHRDFRPKAAYRALAAVCRCLPVSGEQRPAWLDQGDGREGLYALSVGNNAALWTSGSAMEVILSAGAKKPLFLNLMGEEFSGTTTDEPRDEVEKIGANVSNGGPSSLLSLQLRPGDPIFVLGEGVRVVNVVNRPEMDTEAGTIEF